MHEETQITTHLPIDGDEENNEQPNNSLTTQPPKQGIQSTQFGVKISYGPPPAKVKKFLGLKTLLTQVKRSLQGSKSKKKSVIGKK